MIIERIPAISALNEDEEVTLVYELIMELFDSGHESTDPTVVALLENRLRHYQADPNPVVTREDLKACILVGRQT